MICSGTLTGHKCWGWIVSSEKHVRVGPALAAPEGCGCQAVSGEVPAAFQHYIWHASRCSHSRHCKVMFFLPCILDWGYKAASLHGKSAKMRVHRSTTKSVFASDPFRASFQVKSQAFLARLWNGFWEKPDYLEAAQAAQGESESPGALQLHPPEQG